MEGLNVPPGISYCPVCKEPVKGKRSLALVWWVINGIIAAFSYGIWLVIFVPYFLLKPEMCPHCSCSKLEDRPMGKFD